MPELERVTPPSAAEAESLAREMGRAYQRMVVWYREQMELSTGDADRRARAVDDVEWARRAIEAPPDQVSWWNLSNLAEHDPQAMQAAWERVKAAARDELASGHRAAVAVEWQGDPWQRAQFLAVRAAFRDEWQPQGGMEATLIDTMAQAHTAYLFWLEQLQTRSMTEAQMEDHDLKKKGYWQPPRVYTAEAIEQSAAMADRFHRLFLRTLRALRDLRRYAPTVFVQNAVQVNVGAQQLNMAQVGSEPKEE